MNYWVKKSLKKFKYLLKDNGFYDESTARERVKRFWAAKKEEKKVVLFIYDRKSNTSRYRSENICKALEGSKMWRGVGFGMSEIGSFSVLLDAADLVVVVRVVDSGRLKRIVKRVHQRNVKVIYDVDDLVVGGNWLRPMMEATGVRVEKNWKAQGDDYEAAAKRTDGFTTTNDFLGRKLEESFDRSYKVIYNSIGEEFMGDYSGVKHDGFVIGYFSGSPTHANDFGVVAPELTQLLEKYPEMRLLLVGDMELPASMWKFINNGQIIRRAKVNYLKLPELIASVDVNIAPLLINDFTNAKSELKYFEAAAAKVVTVATPSFTFKQAIVDGENGFLAEQGEWYAKIEYLYQHPEERQKIARKAKKEALKIYHGANIMKQAEEAYEYFTKTK